MILFTVAEQNLIWLKAISVTSAAFVSRHAYAADGCVTRHLKQWQQCLVLKSAILKIVFLSLRGPWSYWNIKQKIVFLHKYILIFKCGTNCWKVIEDGEQKYIPLSTDIYFFYLKSCLFFCCFQKVKIQSQGWAIN